VQRAYAELERDGVLSKQRGVGTFVTETAPPRNAKKQVQEFAFKVAAQAKGQGIPLEELTEALARLVGRS
jgi:DNA-binding transcriptional regulator YhcF (GntR family)